MKTITITILINLFLIAAAAAYPAVGYVEFDLDERINAWNPMTERITQQLLLDCYCLDTLEKAEAVITFVQSLRYIDELEDEMIPWLYRGVYDWWQTPDQTLYKGGGDCEDLAMLCYTMLRLAGIRCAIVIMPGHMAIAVDVPAYGAYFDFAGSEYYYVECTDRWPIGEGVVEAYQYSLYTP